MTDDAMPERITMRDAKHRPVDYVRADLVDPHLVTDGMRKTPANSKDWKRRILAYHAIEEAWYEVFWEDEIAEGRSHYYTHWMPLPSPPTSA